MVVDYKKKYLKYKLKYIKAKKQKGGAEGNLRNAFEENQNRLTGIYLLTPPPQPKELFNSRFNIKILWEIPDISGVISGKLNVSVTRSCNPHEQLFLLFSAIKSELFLSDLMDPVKDTIEPIPEPAPVAEPEPVPVVEEGWNRIDYRASRLQHKLRCTESETVTAPGFVLYDIHAILYGEDKLYNYELEEELAAADELLLRTQHRNPDRHELIEDAQDEVGKAKEALTKQINMFEELFKEIKEDAELKVIIKKSQGIDQIVIPWDIIDNRFIKYIKDFVKNLISNEDAAAAAVADVEAVNAAYDAGIDPGYVPIDGENLKYFSNIERFLVKMFKNPNFYIHLSSVVDTLINHKNITVQKLIMTLKCFIIIGSNCSQIHEGENKEKEEIQFQTERIINKLIDMLKPHPVRDFEKTLSEEGISIGRRRKKNMDCTMDELTFRKEQRNKILFNRDYGSPYRHPYRLGPGVPGSVRLETIYDIALEHNNMQTWNFVKKLLEYCEPFTLYKFKKKRDNKFICNHNLVRKYLDKSAHVVNEFDNYYEDRMKDVSPAVMAAFDTYRL